MSGKIRVVGLRELRSDLKKLAEDGTWKADLRGAGLAAAGIVADEAKHRAFASFPNIAGGTTHLGSVGIGSIRPLASQTRASVAGGGASVPYFGGMDFGSHGGSRTRQFPAAQEKGRFIYPAIDAKSDEVVNAYTKALGKVTQKYWH